MLYFITGLIIGLILGPILLGLYVLIRVEGPKESIPEFNYPFIFYGTEWDEETQRRMSHWKSPLIINKITKVKNSDPK